MENKAAIKQDINFLEHGLWQPGKGINKSVTFIDNDGYKFESIRGIPGKVDILTLYFLLLKSQEQKYERKIKTTFYQICQGIDSKMTKEKKERLIESLELWKRVLITFKGTFYDGESYHLLSFGIMDTIKVSDDKRYVEIHFNEEWLQKIKNSGFFKYISFTEMKHLRSPVAIRLYEILSKSFYKRNEWQISANKLKEKLSLQEEFYSHIRHKIQASINTINRKTDMNIKVAFKKTKKNDGIITFTKIEPSIKQLFDEEREFFQKQEAIKPQKTIDERLFDILHDKKEDELNMLKENFYDEIIKDNSFLKKRYKKNGYDNISVKQNFYSWLKNKQEIADENK